MIYYAANVTQLYPNAPLADRLGRAGAAGFAAVELLFPQRENLAELLDLKQQHDLDLALFDLEFDDQYPRGQLNAASDRPFLDRLDEALTLARKLDCKRLNALVGATRQDVSREAQIDLIVDRLRRAAPVVAAEGITLLIEALNSHANPTYFLRHSAEGVAIVKAVDHPNVKFQYDYYHMQIMEGNLIETVRANLPYIGHYQIADVPGRHEPGTGEINYANVLADLAATGYDGYVGLEYVSSSHALNDPAGDEFAWLPRADRARRLPR